MKFMGRAPRFFIGAKTRQGFIASYKNFSDINPDWRILIIKGGPGGGKSTLLKTVAKWFEEERLELVHCSSDAESLDAVLNYDRRFLVVDGTPPHDMEMRYPGAIESIIDLTNCLDQNALYDSRAEIVRINKLASHAVGNVEHLLGAAEVFMNDTMNISMESVDIAKLNAYCKRVCENEFALVSRNGKIHRRFISSITAKGQVTFTETGKILCERIYVISDDLGAVSNKILANISSGASAAGYDVICCYNPISALEKMEHIFIPERKLGFMTSNRFHDLSDVIEAYRYVNIYRFTDRSKLHTVRPRIAFNRKSIDMTLGHAVDSVHEAMIYHSQLEQIYGTATNFQKVNDITGEVIDRLGTMPKIVEPKE
jgi:hypothetical protein